MSFNLLPFRSLSIIFFVLLLGCGVKDVPTFFKNRKTTTPFKDNYPLSKITQNLNDIQRENDHLVEALINQKCTPTQSKIEKLSHNFQLEEKTSNIFLNEINFYIKKDNQLNQSLKKRIQKRMTNNKALLEKLSRNLKLSNNKCKA